MDYYDILGISKTASADEIKTAYRTAAKMYHPDVSKEEGAEDKFKQASEAYEVLSDEAKKANYDQYGSADAPQMGNPFNHNFDPSSMFEEFFGRSRQQHRANSEITVQIDLEPKEFLNGVKKSIDITRVVFCSTCDGEGGSEPTMCAGCMGKGVIMQQVQNGPFTMMQTAHCFSCNGKGKTFKNQCTTCAGGGQVHIEEQVELNIPPLCPVYSTLQMLGKGNIEHKNLSPGALYVRLNVKIVGENSVDSDGNVDVIQDISLNDWYNNNDVEINRFDVEQIKYNLKELTRSSQKLRLQKRGLQDSRNQNQGDLVVTFRINK